MAEEEAVQIIIPAPYVCPVCGARTETAEECKGTLSSYHVPAWTIDEAEADRLVTESPEYRRGYEDGYATAKQEAAANDADDEATVESPSTDETPSPDAPPDGVDAPTGSDDSTTSDPVDGATVTP